MHANILAWKYKHTKNKSANVLSNTLTLADTNTGWGTVIRTQECRSQSPMPYRLAIPQ